jgi:type II secretion system protein J
VTPFSSLAKAGAQLGRPFLQPPTSQNWAQASAGERGRGTGSEAGFTLIEVMVSLMIFGMIAAAGVAILSFSVKAQSVTGAKLDDLSALTRTMSILSADLAQASNRPARDEAGTSVPAFVGESGSGLTPMLRLVRAGWSNIDGAPRSSMQKVAYRVDGGTLQRIAYPMIDGAQPLRPAALLTKVRLITLRYRIAGAWSDRWDGASGRPLPDAMELTVQRYDGTQFRQMFLVGTSYVPAPGDGSGPAITPRPGTPPPDRTPQKETPGART